VSPGQLQTIDLILGGLLVLSRAHTAFEPGQGPLPIVPLGVGLTHPTLEILLPGLGAGLAIALRRWQPLPALALIAVCISVSSGSGVSPVLDPFVAIPMYQVAANYERRRSLPALVVVAALFVGGSVVHLVASHHAQLETLGLVFVVAAWFVGDSVRARRTYVAGLAEQAAQRQRETEERAQRSVAEERLQIARELHDVVAHSLSVIAVQSGVGRHVIDSQPAEAKKAPASVEATRVLALD